MAIVLLLFMLRHIRLGPPFPIPVAAHVAHPDIISGYCKDVGEAVLARGKPAGRVGHHPMLQ